MADQTLEQLRSAGIAVDQIPEPQREVLAELSSDEVDTVIKVRERLQKAGDGEVEPHAMDRTGVFYY